MTKTLPELLCSDAWWQDVGPALSPDGRALVKETLTQASATLGEEESQKFAKALSALRAPRPEQLAWLRDVAAVQTLPESEDILDLSDILICHPDTGAKIILEGFKFPAVRFNGSVFVGNVSFFMATFTGEANFTKATFAGEASFHYAMFAAEANFGQATFTGEANFEGARFKRFANFTEATFAGITIFRQVTFKSGPEFWGATFTGKANFEGAKFAGITIFRQVTFKGEAEFYYARFERHSYFQQATFTGKANFEAATFEREADFQHTEFLGITIFREAHFKQVANFHAARFSKTVSFRGSDWGAVPDFIGTAWKDGVAIADFEQLQTQLNKGELDWRNPSTSDPAPITDRLQALRKMARDADDRPRELDYFALELQARYQSKGAWAKRCLVGLYGGLSNHGRGVGRPFWWLVGLWALSALIYGVLAVGDWSVLSKDRLFALTYGVLPDVDWSLWDNALLLSLVNALPPLGASSWVRESILKASYCEEVRSLVGFIAVVEGVIGLILLFLIALGLRNRFRL
jgi:uncharacterized protein YjbI with pentapeptide repeats